MSHLGTKTKRTKGADIYPPREIRDNTKARRAWLAEKLAEVTAQPNVEAKVVGIGSYQRVSVWNLTQVAGRVQFRGVCQACGSSVAVEAGLTSLHGYKRPGTGETVGRCVGAQVAPAEISLDLYRRVLDALREKIGRRQAFAANCDAWAESFDRAGRAALDAGDREHFSFTYREQQKLERKARDERWIASQEEQHCTFLETAVWPRLGQPLAEIVM